MQRSPLMAIVAQGLGLTPLGGTQIVEALVIELQDDAPDIVIEDENINIEVVSDVEIEIQDDTIDIEVE
jgi:hypothetical protein